jgi:general secretion pathway protein A
MYSEFYGFREKPFSNTPNTRFLFLSKNHQEALAHLRYGVSNHAGFIELTGEVGTGKTTVLRTLLNQLDEEQYRVALIFNPFLSASELLRSINREYGITTEGAGNAEFLDALYQFLLQENRAGRTVVLIIDEAQDLAPPVLEQIRLISNLETEADKLIQIVLAGQPELASLLARPELRQLRQRITVRYHLGAMDFADTQAYINHRLTMAGDLASDTFAPSAVQRIFRYARGIPRLINSAGDRLLLLGYAEGKRALSGRLAAQAIAELEGRSVAPPRWKGWRAAVLLLVLAAAGGFLVGIRVQRNVTAAPPAALQPTVTRTQPATTPAAPPATAKEMPVAPVSPAEKPASDAGITGLLGNKLPESPVPAVNALLGLWQEPPLTLARPVRYAAELVRPLARRGLRLSPVNGKLPFLASMDAPVLLELKVPGQTHPRYLALTGVSATDVQLAPSPTGEPISRMALDKYWSGRSYLLWKNVYQIPIPLPAGSQGIEVIRLQELLAGSGQYQGEPSGIMDSSTRAALKSFQKKRGLRPSGELTPLTLYQLYRHGREIAPPRLAAEPKEGGS